MAIVLSSWFDGVVSWLASVVHGGKWMTNYVIPGSLISSPGLECRWVPNPPQFWPSFMLPLSLAGKLRTGASGPYIGTNLERESYVLSSSTAITGSNSTRRDSGQVTNIINAACDQQQLRWTNLAYIYRKFTLMYILKFTPVYILKPISKKYT